MNKNRNKNIIIPKKQEKKKSVNGKGSSIAVPDNVKERLGEVIDGRILVKDTFQKQVPFFIFLIGLAFLYMWSTHNTNKIAIEIENTKRDIIDLKYDYIASKKELIDISLSDNMLKLIDEYDFQESKTPPNKIVVSKEVN